MLFILNNVFFIFFILFILIINALSQNVYSFYIVTSHFVLLSIMNNVINFIYKSRFKQVFDTIQLFIT